MLSLADVRNYLDESEATLLEELELSRGVLHRAAEGEWTVAQVIHHLVRTEQIMYLMWIVVPKLGSWPRVLAALDRANVLLWRMMGMRTVQSGALDASNPEAGKYRAPIFLRPGDAGQTYESLLAWRRTVRERSLRAIAKIDEDTLRQLRWSHPLLGSFTLMEFAQFLGIHEHHHLPQIKRIRDTVRK